MNALLAAMTAVVFLAVSANVHASREDRVANDIGIIGGILGSAYAPAEWKTSLLGWDLDAEVTKAQNSVRAKSTNTTREYQKIARNLLRTTQDYHVGYNFDRTEAATLPFTVKSAEGKYYIVHIDREQLSTTYPVSVGDEIVSVDGQAVDEIVQELKEQIGQGVPSTDQAIAELTLTSRRAAKALTVPQGKVLITVKSKETQDLRSFQIQWTYTPEVVKFADERTPTLLARSNSSNGKTRLQQNIDRLKNLTMAMGDWLVADHSGENVQEESKSEEEKESEESEEAASAGPKTNPYVLGGRDSFLPKLGKKVWSSSPMSFFQAYIYENNGKKIGYIRIPSYSGSTFHFVDFVKNMIKLKAETDGLVIDQLNNPGGSVFYLYALVSTLIDQPAKTPRHQVKLSSSEVMMAHNLLKMLPQVTSDTMAKMVLGPDWDGYPMNYQTMQFIIDYLRFIVTEWETGKDLSDPVHLYGVDYINPSAQVNYDKPILLLVNELDFSGGDFFPTILQDNQRARIMGVRTAGAGGFVLAANYPNTIGLSRFTYTGSIAIRPSGSPIENLGVTPDVVQELTSRDLQEGYVDYMAAVNAEIDRMTTPATKTPVPTPALQ